MEENKRISTLDALKFGFSIVIENVVFFLGLAISYFALVLGAIIVGAAVAVVPYLLKTGFTQQDFAQAMTTHNLQALNDAAFAWLVIGVLAFALWSAFVTNLLKLGFTKICLEFYDRGSSTLSRLFSCWPLVIKGIVGATLYGLLFLPMLTLILVPLSIYWLVTYWFFVFALVDTNCGVIEAFKYSAQLTKGVKMQLLGFFIIFWMINVMASFLMGVGLLVTLPAFTLAQAYMYRRLQRHVTL